MLSDAAGCEPAFDLLLAADVLVYIGDLQPVLGAAADAATERCAPAAHQPAHVAAAWPVLRHAARMPVVSAVCWSSLHGLESKHAGELLLLRHMVGLLACYAERHLPSQRRCCQTSRTPHGQHQHRSQPCPRVTRVTLCSPLGVMHIALRMWTRLQQPLGGECARCSRALSATMQGSQSTETSACCNGVEPET